MESSNKPEQATADTTEPMFAVRISLSEMLDFLEAPPAELSDLSNSIFEKRAVPIDPLQAKFIDRENVSPNQSQSSPENALDRIFFVKQRREQEEEESPAGPTSMDELDDEEEETWRPVESPERKEESETLCAPTSHHQQQPASTAGVCVRAPIVFTLNNLPFFNMTKIICCFSVADRLVMLSQISKRIRQSVYQPQCFRDVSFFPVEPDEDTGGVERPPKILNVHTPANSQMIRTGITYVEVCMASNHPFVTKVAKYGGMWNFKAELFNKIEWPADLSVESLQLSLDPNTDVRVLDLCDGLPATSKEKISNLFLIKFETEGFQPQIMFPTKLQGVGLQSFNSNAFRSSWWKFQIEDKRVFESIRFLVLSCCTFHDDELQRLISKRGCPKVEHLSLRYVKWEGCVDIPAALVSFGFFPDAGEYLYRLPDPNSLWQVQTRLCENIDASIDMLNRVHASSPDLRRISFEFIRGEATGGRGMPINVDDIKKWGHADETVIADERFDEMTIVVDPLQWMNQPRLKEAFEFDESQFLPPVKANFLDCPKWSADARDFIQMTARRKLLLR